MDDVDICLLRPVTLPLVIVEHIIVVIKVVIILEVYIGRKIPSTLTLSMVDKEFMLTGEVNIDLRPVTLPYIS